MIRRILYRSLLVLLVMTSRPSQAQEEAVMLVLKDGGEIQATVYDIWQGEVYFRAASSIQAYEYGEMIALAKIERVRLEDGRLLRPQEFVQHWKGEANAPSTDQAQRSSASRASTPAPPPADYRPGLRLQSV